MAATPPLVITSRIDTSDTVAQLRGMSKAFADAADAIEKLDGRTVEADPIAGTVAADGDAQP